MSTGLIWRTESTNTDDTLAIASALGRKLRGGEIIELVSDLGGGKTTFVRGLAKGVGSKDVVRSPSFTLSNEYRAEALTIYHFDFYRLADPGILSRELTEMLEDEQGVIVIEWGQIVEDVLPAERLQIRFIVTGEHSRNLDFSYPANLSYLINT